MLRLQFKMLGDAFGRFCHYFHSTYSLSVDARFDFDEVLAYVRKMAQPGEIHMVQRPTNDRINTWEGDFYMSNSIGAFKPIIEFAHIPKLHHLFDCNCPEDNTCGKGQREFKTFKLTKVE